MIEFKQIHDIENFYKTQFKMRFGKVPRTTHSDRNQLEQLLQQYGEKESAMLIETFFKMNDPFFKKVGYTLEYFFKNINKVIIEAKTVKAPRETKSKQLMQTLGFCKNIHCKNRPLITVTASFDNLDSQLCGECE